ncbi:hypothetical protein LWI28_007635 [Acer negundo]|uniref:RNase H type-1 domain-containing protein n=1 Tax=Acer negundo TaxID=4023 RepID=A0AAD5IIN7_ACENE|nr:hypothetical protein LWI28_007635 [Acer negundo]
MVRWCPLSVEYFKLDTDASLNTRIGCVGIGAVIRDHCGHVLVASSQRIDMSYTVEITEAMAMLQGNVLAVETWVVSIVVESGALSVVNQVVYEVPMSADVGIVVCD